MNTENKHNSQRDHLLIFSHLSPLTSFDLHISCESKIGRMCAQYMLSSQHKYKIFKLITLQYIQSSISIMKTIFFSREFDHRTGYSYDNIVMKKVFPTTYDSLFFIPFVPDPYDQISKIERFIQKKRRKKSHKNDETMPFAHLSYYFLS